MRNYSTAILVCFVLLPLVNNAQSITGNLKYINEQFSLYNGYKTSFNVDTRTKELICEDEFGILKAYWKDVEMRVSDSNVGIFCLDGDDKCIRYYDKSGNRKYDEDYNNYTMGLNSDDELIPHVNVVITKFEELKRLTLASNENVNSTLVANNLKYINEQFALYNGYETVFSIDEGNKKIICQDKFGILKANLSDVEIKIEGGNLGIFCLNSNDKCIEYYDKNGERKYGSEYNQYTMGLKKNEKIIPHINTVLDKFSEIKQSILGGNSSTGNGNLNAKIDAELYTINAIFQRSSEYKNTYSFDYSTNTITSRTENCKAVVPIKNGLSVNYYKREGGDYGEGFYFENADNSILESCTSFEDYTEKTYEYVNNYSDVQTVIRSLNNIISLAKGNTSSTYTAPSGNSEAILNYINEEFSKYNAYNTVWKIDYKTKQLIWSNDFGTNYVDFNSSEIRIDHANNWIGVYCLTGDKCIKQITTSGSATYYDQYTMSLNDNSKMIGHIATVANKFAELKNIVLNNTSSKPSNHEGDSPD